jgi:hypothetical protein
MRGDDLHNLVTCVMDEYQTDVNGAILWVEDFLLGAAGKVPYRQGGASRMG